MLDISEYHPSKSCPICQQPLKFNHIRRSNQTAYQCRPCEFFVHFDQNDNETFYTIKFTRNNNTFMFVSHKNMNISFLSQLTPKDPYGSENPIYESTNLPLSNFSLTYLDRILTLISFG